MKNRTYILAALLFVLVSCESQTGVKFNKYFTEGTMRIDYFHSGDATSETVEIDQVYQYEGWAGSLINLLDTIDYGAYYYKIYSPDGKLIYSKGFDSYFKEYQLTTPAIEGEVKQYHESAIIPLPKKTVVFALDKRDKEGALFEVFRFDIDPESAIAGQQDDEIKVFTSLDNGNPNIKADVVIVGEGYTAEEEQKFQDDLARFTDIFFMAEPCKSYKDRFNIRGVLKYSEESGVDEPRSGIDKNTAVNATFNSLGSARYLLTEDNKSLRDIAGHVPYDAIYIMVNHDRYGGGGIYNFYCVYTADNDLSSYLMVHEFGHSFFGLADEYYSSSTAYNDFYTTEFEPNEPNITALKDPENVKWKHLLSEGIEIPTPWSKEAYDSSAVAWPKENYQLYQEISQMKKEGASKEKIEAAEAHYTKRKEERKTEVYNFMNNELSGKVGAFEGAGYMYNGMYRPSLNCIMFSHAEFFCPVCQDAMIKMIRFYSE